ncbi:MAG: hypothetical protein ACTSU5_16355 [Promethearchaeota archaeon]
MPPVEFTKEELELIVQMIDGLMEDDLISSDLLPVADSIKNKITSSRGS